MPIVKMANNEGDAVERYKFPAEYVTPVNGIYGYLIEKRKLAIKEQEFFAGAKREIGRGSLEAAKMMKEHEKHWLKMQRAITYALPWFGVPDKNQEPIPMHLWPVDMAAELDEVGRGICLEFG